MTVNTQGAEQALIAQRIAGLEAKNDQLKSTLAESVSLVAEQHAKIECLENDLNGCIKLIADQETKINLQLNYIKTLEDEIKK